MEEKPPCWAFRNGTEFGDSEIGEGDWEGAYIKTFQTLWVYGHQGLGWRFYQNSNHFFYHVFYAWDPSTSCILLMKRVAVVTDWFKFFIYKIPSIWVFFIDSISNFMSLTVLSLFLHYVLLDFLKGFIHFLFHDLYHIPQSYFKVFFLCFKYVGISMLAVVDLCAIGKTYCSGYCWICFYKDVAVSGFGMIINLGADLWIFLVGFCSLVSVCFLDFQSMNIGVLPVSLSHSAGIFKGNAWRCWRLGN